MGLQRKCVILALGIISITIIVLAVPFALFVAGGAIVLALGIVGLVLGGVFLGMLGISAIFFLLLLFVMGILFGFVTQPLTEILLAVLVLYVLYRWWQHHRVRAAF